MFQQYVFGRRSQLKTDEAVDSQAVPQGLVHKRAVLERSSEEQKMRIQNSGVELIYIHHEGDCDLDRSPAATAI